MSPEKSPRFAVDFADNESHRDPRPTFFDCFISVVENNQSGFSHGRKSE
jgi:hypothetical protein